jgi:hypothetical protein
VLSDVHRQPLVRSVIAIAATVWLLVAGASGDVDRSVHSTPDPAHTILTSFSGESAVNADHAHAHVDTGSSLTCLELFASAVLPWWAPTLVALGLLVVLATVVGSFAERVLQPWRGPPRERATVITGQDLLTQFCVARR